MLVFGSLGPGGDEIRELEAAWRWAALGDEPRIAGIATDVLPHHLALLEVFPDVVQVEVDGGRVAAGRPLFGWRVEGDIGF